MVARLIRVDAFVEIFQTLKLVKLLIFHLYSYVSHLVVEGVLELITSVKAFPNDLVMKVYEKAEYASCGALFIR